jgi:hypothetical protein
VNFECFLSVRILRFLLLILAVQPLYGQISYTAELGGLYSATNRTPFWIKANRFGVLPDSGNTVYFRHTVQWRPDSLHWDLGAELVSWTGDQSRLGLVQAYASYSLGAFRFLVGRKKQIHGYTDSTLSSGSMTWSGNALPLPELQVSVPQYRSIIPGVLAFKGHFSHAWFGNQHFVKNYYLHQKSLYLRWGTGSFKVITGIMHHAQWGGKPKYDPGPDGWLTHGKQFASGAAVYREIIFPFTNPPRDSAKVASFDFENRYGNHLGQLDLGLEWQLNSGLLKVYRQLPFETGQTFSSLGNFDDGICGLAFSREEGAVRRLVFEFLHTTNQGLYRSGLLRFLGYKGRHYGRNQNFYFSHAQYVDGWSYEGKTLGSPFLLPNPEIRDEKHVDSPNYFANNNNIKAAYLGLITRLNTVDMESRLSYSQNFGTYHRKMEAYQLSFAHKMLLPIGANDARLGIEVGIDHGDLIRDNFSLLLSWKKTWE